jgi:hypothetical protein
MTTLHTDDKDIEYRNEYDLLVDVYFKDEKFTGTLKDDVQHIEYKNGVVDGRLIEFFDTGVTRVTDIYDKGKFVSGKKYYKNGNLNTETLSKPYSYKVWNLDSIIIRQDNKFYYLNGQIKKIYGGDNDSYSIKGFDKTGELIYTVQKDIWIDGQCVRNVVYEDEILNNCYFDLLTEENPELADTEEKNDTYQIWMWFWTIFEKDKSKYLDIVNNLMTHPSREVISTIANIIASHKYHNFIDKETNENAECYELIKERTMYQDNNFPNRQIREFLTQ